MTPVLVDQYGGLCTLIDRSDLPVGLSPACQNVEFFPGGVRSRSGFVVHAAIGFDGCDMLTHVTPAGTRTLLVLCSTGQIVGGPVEVAPAAIPFGAVNTSTLKLGTDLRMRGTSMFGRAYFGLYGGWDTRQTTATVSPICGPFQYDGTTISPVTQEGPPAPFAVTATGGGTIGMSLGYHSFVVVYETASGYVTAPSAPVGATFAAGDYAAISLLPRGPGAISKRIIFATPANSTSFFTLPRFALNDNTTTTLNVDFTDAELLSGASLEDYIDRPRIPPVMGVEKYGRRMVYWGALNQLYPFFDGDSTSPPRPVLVGLQGLDFDGQLGTLPLPWTATTAGGAVSTQDGASLQVYRITGNGVGATRGTIDQVAANVALSGTYYIKSQRTYGLRVRVRKNSALLAGTLAVTLRGSTTNVAGSGTVLASMSVPHGNLADTEWALLSSAGTLVAANYPYVNMTVEATGTPTNTGTFEIDYIQVYDVADPSSKSVLWISDPDAPESVNITTGLVPVAEDDGQEIRDVFELRGNLYVCKEHSLYVTTDDGNEPVDWKVDQVSNVVGTVSPHGVAVGDGWATILDRDGLYYFTGGMPDKISQEIQPTTDGLGWGWGIKSWTAVDPGDKRIYIGVPAAGSTAVADIAVLDYVEGFGDPIASGGSGRKWTTWTQGSSGPHPAGIMAERAKLTSSFLVISGTDLFVQSAAAVADVTTPIVSYYETAPMGAEIGRSLFDRLVVRIRGVGSLLANWRSPGGTLTALPTKTLAASPDDDIEIRLRAQHTQVGFRIGTSAAADYWSCRRLAVFLKPSEFSYLRKT